MLLLLERLLIELIKFFPEIIIKSIKAEVGFFLKVMEETFFEDSYSILYTAFVLRLFNLSRKNDRMVMVSPFSIVFV